MKDLGTRRSLLKQLLLAAVVAPLVVLASQSSTRAQQAPTSTSQISEAAGVKVQVKPKPIQVGARELAFGVSLDTHDQPLDDDLGQIAVLVVDGTELKPLRTSGGAAGGHHRDVVLTFDVPSMDFKTVELRLQRPGESSPRIFRWDAAAWR